MDALWFVAEQILTPAEIDNLTPAEAFLIGAAFYLHDIGMAYAATKEGMISIKSSPAYRAAMVQGRSAKIPMLEARALGIAIRAMHADAAKELATNEIPGSAGRYLFEALSFREAWGSTCGELASSHHWTLSRLEDQLGPRCDAPLPGNRTGDLLYVAACLRLIDYAHINRDRAPSIDRTFRGDINDASLIHWYAQEHIDGPTRAGNELVYRALKPIADVEAWWLFYQMLKGLDEEIRGVRRLLERRKEGQKRIALSNVRGAASPEEAAVFIPTAGYLPIEINLRTGSIDRLVELLAGETLYGPNPMAAVRELIQNARDAVMLKGEVAIHESELASLSIPIRITVDTKVDPPILEIIDNGVGMNKTVMTDCLISIASDYWTTQFATDFPQAAERGFKSASKFGIGFLSVFLLGSEVTVESNRSGGERYRMTLRGVGRRGELRSEGASSGSGTKIRIKLKREALEGISPLDTLVGIYAPTLPHALRIEVDGSQTQLLAGWLKRLDIDAFELWVMKALETIRSRNKPKGELADEDIAVLSLGPYSSRNVNKKSLWRAGRPEYNGEVGRLIASFGGWSLLSLRGLAVQPVSTPGFVGVVELDSAALEVSRNRTVNADITKVLEVARATVVPQVIKNFNAHGQTGLLIDKYELIASCVHYYGKEVLLGSDLPWVNQLIMPGDVKLISSGELLKKATNAKSIFVAFNTGPWTAMKKWAKSDPSAGELAVLIDSGEMHRGLEYRSSIEGEKIGKSLEPLAQSC